MHALPDDACTSEKRRRLYDKCAWYRREVKSCGNEGTSMTEQHLNKPSFTAKLRPLTLLHRRKSLQDSKNEKDMTKSACLTSLCQVRTGTSAYNGGIANVHA